MKKKMSAQERRKQQRAQQNKEMNELNSSLGSFGLEPPKIYRSESRITSEDRRSATTQNNNRNKSKKNTKSKSQTPPRTKQQRREAENERRKKNKLKRKILFYFAMAVALVGIIIILSLTVLFKINTININGNKKYTNEEISAVLPISKNQNLFIADSSNAKEKLTQTLPYIYSVEIKRKIPSTIEVNITETPTVYSIKNQDKTYTLLDDNLKVLETNAKKTSEKAIEIKKAAVKTANIGQEVEFTDKKLKKNLLKLIDVVKRLSLDKTTAVQSDDINNNYIVYDGRVTFKLGSTDDLDNKIYSALSAMEKLDESNPEVEGTMTVTNGKQVYFTEQ